MSASPQLVLQHGNAMTEMPASLIASTCSLIVLHNGDATNSTFFSLRLSFTAANNWSILNFSQNLWEELPQHPFAPVNPKQPGAALLWARIYLKIVPNSCQACFSVNPHSDTKDMVNMVNTSLQMQMLTLACVHPGAQFANVIIVVAFASISCIKSLMHKSHLHKGEFEAFSRRNMPT